MTVRIVPTHMKKNVDAIRLADIGLSTPTLATRRYSIMPAMSASAKLTTENTIESFCNRPFLLSTQINPSVFSDRASILYSAIGIPVIISGLYIYR